MVGSKPGNRLKRGCSNRTEHLFGHAVIVGNPPSADFGPNVVSATRDDHGEMLSRKLAEAWQLLVLRRTKFVEGVLEFNRQQLRHDAADGLDGQTAARKLNLPGRRNDIRLVAGVHDERLAIDADHCLEQ